MYITYPNHNAFSNEFNNGLTKREYFAAMAMQGLLAGSYDSMAMGYASISEAAVGHADALIEALNKEGGSQ